MDPASHQTMQRGVIAVIARRNRLLVIRRSASVVAPRAFCFPGGTIEPGESEAQALVREISEELGTTAIPIQPLWQSTTPWNVQLAWWHAELSDEATMTPDPDEVESVHWLTVREILALNNLLASNQEFLASWQQGRFEIAGLRPF